MSHDFIQIPHTADIQIRAFGSTRQELFCNALIGMFQVVHPIIAGARVIGERVVCDSLPIRREITVTGTDIDMLLVEFLSEALYLSDVHNEAYLDAEIIHMTDTSVQATLKGAQVTGFQVVELKAVTYHGLAIKQVDGMWQVDVVFDI